MFGFGKKKKFEPLTVENECGKFTMGYYGNDPDEPTHRYEGTVEWCGQETDVEVECDTEDILTADKGFVRLAGLLADPEEAKKLDNKIKDCVFEEIVQEGDIDHFIYWDDKKKCMIENPEPVTKEQFLEQIKLRYIIVYDNDWVEFNFALFTHVELRFYIDNEGNTTWERPGDTI